MQIFNWLKKAASDKQIEIYSGAFNPICGKIKFKKRLLRQGFHAADRDPVKQEKQKNRGDGADENNRRH